MLHPWCCMCFILFLILFIVQWWIQGVGGEGKGEPVPPLLPHACTKFLWFLIIGQLQNRCGDAFYLFYFFGNLFFLSSFFFFLFSFFGNQWITWYMVIGTRPISHTQIMVAKRGLTNRADVYVKMSLKNTARQNSNRSSNFGCNWTLFHSKKNKKKISNADAQLWGDTPRNQRLFVWPYHTIIFVSHMFGSFSPPPIYKILDPWLYNWTCTLPIDLLFCMFHVHVVIPCLFVKLTVGLSGTLLEVWVLYIDVTFKTPPDACCVHALCMHRSWNCSHCMKHDCTALFNVFKPTLEMIKFIDRFACTVFKCSFQCFCPLLYGLFSRVCGLLAKWH